jgi:hypothetical protein
VRFVPDVHYTTTFAPMKYYLASLRLLLKIHPSSVLNSLVSNCHSDFLPQNLFSGCQLLATFLCRCLQNRSREGCKTDHEMLQNRSLHVTVVLTLLILCEVTVELQIRDRICTQKHTYHSKMMCHRDTCAEAGRSAERLILDK